MKYNKKANELEKQINTVLIGKEDKVRFAVITLLAGGHLLLEDVPGVGKTTLALAIARSIDCSFGRIQFTPDTLPSDITGLSVYNMQTGKFDFYDGPVMNNIILADEINRTSPKTQSSLLEAMAEGQVTVEGRRYVLEAPFMVIATQNPIDFTGTYRLPEAQLDRFLMKISLGYPSPEEEARLSGLFLKKQTVNELKPIASAKEIVAMQNEVAQIKVHEDVITYIVDIINSTRHNKRLVLGASPRATLALIRAAQAAAYLNERDYVIPDDVKKVYIQVLGHRLITSAEAAMNNVSFDTILTECLSTINVPVV